MSEPFTNIAAHLPAMARAQPHAPAIFFPEGRNHSGQRLYSHYTYAQLDRESDAIARGLIAYGIGRGVRTVLMVRPSLEFFALTFGLFKAGAIPVMVDPGIGRARLKRCLAEAEPEAFVGIPLAHTARVLLGWGRASIEKKVTVGRRFFWGGTTLAAIKAAGAPDADGAPRLPGPLADPLASTDPDDVAAILFTSGSTGIPKGVVYRHRHFLAQVESIKTHYGISPGEIDLPTFPLFALFDPALGMTTVIPDMDPTRPGFVDPEAIFEAIDDFGVTNMFGSPALLRRVGRAGEAAGKRLPTLRRVISSGAPVSAAVMRPFVSMLEPDAAIHPSYGATEALPVASITSQEVLAETAAMSDRGHGICVGRPVAQLEVKIIAITDDPIETLKDTRALPAAKIGEIIVRGPQVTDRYFRREESTRLAKIRDGETFFHRMGDVGYLDEAGRLWFCGRKAHRVGLPTGDLYTVPCEGVFDAHPKVLRSALVAVPDGDGHAPLVCVELEAAQRETDRAQLFAELRALAQVVPITAAIECFLVHPAFPVDIRHNAKIDRAALATWAAGRR